MTRQQAQALRLHFRAAFALPSLFADAFPMWPAPAHRLEWEAAGSILRAYACARATLTFVVGRLAQDGMKKHTQTT
ncbi:hypothetical protein B0H13DRAFT_2313232 [Mycena leptocephala]|nr:hypothetical protein B0H13DRAFT_2313232 [Mycena leptocephala]